MKKERISRKRMSPRIQKGDFLFGEQYVYHKKIKSKKQNLKGKDIGGYGYYVRACGSAYADTAFDTSVAELSEA
jgi:hypothetical protein